MFHASHLVHKFVREDRDVGFLETRGGEYVDDAFRRHRPGDDLANGVIQFFFGARLIRGTLEQP